MPPKKTKEKQMNNYIRIIAAALCFGMPLLLAPPSSAQGKNAKLEAISQQLKLTPEQKAKILPILAAEGPKVQKIKNDNSLSKFQKIQQIKAIHQQTDPQMKAILSPEQYQKLQGIRQQAIRDAVQARFF
jgi:Spy/CpxP family protein refolding chaperone